MLRRADFFEPDMVKFNRPTLLLLGALLYDNVGILANSIISNSGEDDPHKRFAGKLLDGAGRLFDLATR